MAIIELKVPSPGESITEVVIARWIKNDGDYVEKDDELCEIDSDKATLTINAEESGALKIMAAEGDTVNVGQVICSVDTSVKGEAKPKKEETLKQVQSDKKEEKKQVQSVTPNPMPVAQEKSYATGHPSPSAQK